MTSVELIPINFKVSPAAASELRRLTEKLSLEEGRQFVPVVLWHEEYEEVQLRLVEHGLVIGWHYVEDVRPHIQCLEGLDLVFGVRAERAERFVGRTIDFRNDRFQFAD